MESNEIGIMSTEVAELSDFVELKGDFRVENGWGRVMLLSGNGLL